MSVAGAETILLSSSTVSNACSVKYLSGAPGRTFNKVAVEFPIRRVRAASGTFVGKSTDRYNTFHAIKRPSAFRKKKATGLGTWKSVFSVLLIALLLI